MSDDQDFFDLAGTKANQFYVSMRLLRTHPEDSEYGMFSALVVDLRAKRRGMRFALWQRELADDIMQAGSATKADLVTLRNLIAERIASKLDILPENVVIYMMRLSIDGNIYTYNDREPK